MDKWPLPLKILTMFFVGFVAFTVPVVVMYVVSLYPMLSQVFHFMLSVGFCVGIGYLLLMKRMFP